MPFTKEAVDQIRDEIEVCKYFDINRFREFWAIYARKRK